MADNPNPVEFFPRHPPRTELEQLTAALDAGLITPALFALAKEKLLTEAAPVTSDLAQAIEQEEVEEPDAAETTPGELPPLASFFVEPPPVAVAPAPPVTQVPPVATAAPTPMPAPSPAPMPAFYPAATQAALPKVEAPPRAEAPPVAGQPVSLPVSAAPAPAVPSPRPADAYDQLTSPAEPAAKVQKPTPVAPAAPRIWPKVLGVLGVLGLLLLVYWQVAGSHPDEQLTTPRQPTETAAPTAPAPVAAKSSRKRKRSTKASRAKKAKATPQPQPVTETTVPEPDSQDGSEPAAVAPQPVVAAAKPVSVAKSARLATASDDGGPLPSPAPQPVPPAPETGDNEAATSVRTAMAAYYADMLAPPFTAAQHFAPRVQRLYIQQNLTPADIDANFRQNFFPDNKQAVLRVEPGTLRVSAPVADGSRMATFVEASRVYHPSRQGYQRLRAQVRVRFDKNYKIVYLRQERLLESKFE